MIAVDIKGNIYPCHRFVALKEMCIGNIFRGWNRENAKDLMRIYSYQIIHVLIAELLIYVVEAAYSKIIWKQGQSAVLIPLYAF